MLRFAFLRPSPARTSKAVRRGRETGQNRVIDGAAFNPARSVPRGRDAAGRACAQRLGPHRETWTGSSSAAGGTRSPGRRPRGAGGRRRSPARAGSRAAGAGAARASSPGSRHLVDGKSGGISCSFARIVAGHGRRDAPGGWERGSGRRGGYGHRRRGGAVRHGGLAAMVRVAGARGSGDGEPVGLEHSSKDCTSRKINIQIGNVNPEVGASRARPG